MNTSDSGKEFLSANPAAEGNRFLVTHPAASGVNRAAERSTIICGNGISNCDPTTVYTMKGSTKGTASEVVIIMPTTSGSLPPTRLTTNGAPSPVEMPDRRSTGSANGSWTRYATPYIPSGSATNLIDESMIICLGLVR